MKAGGAARWRVGDGEEARLTPGAEAEAEVWSRGFLPLRVRSLGSDRVRPSFPGTAVVLGGDSYEVLTETELPEDGLVVYRLRRWPDGEVVRDRVVYGLPFVRAAEAERERSRARARPWRLLLYPVVGLLPEEQQERLSDRFGLYAVTATLVSGLAECLVVVLLLLFLAARASDPGATIGLLVSLPGLILLALPGLGRAFGAALLRETGGSPLVVLASQALLWMGASRRRRDATLLPLTRKAFWERLSRPDAVEPAGDGSLVFRGLLPHLTWERGRRIRAGRDHWQVSAEPPALEGGRLVYTFRLALLGDLPPEGEPPPAAPPATAYADEVLAEVGREWDDWNAAFAWYTSLLTDEVQSRAFGHRGGPPAARRATLATAWSEALAGLYLLSFLPGGPAADPLAPVALALGSTLLADAARRIRATRGGRYAPSLLRWALPTDVLRPERVAYRAHREAERQAIDRLGERCP